MIDMILTTLRELGWMGLFIGVAVEALSIPFPAAIIFLLYGYLIDPTGMDLVWLSLASAAIYTAVAFLPYALSVKFKYVVERRIRTGRAQRMVRFMQKYRGWTIAAGRVLGMGYIVYVAAFCRISPARYGIFTFIGVLPVAFLMLYLGGLGNVEAVYAAFQQVQYVITAVIVLAIGGYVYYRIRQRKKHHKRQL
ncbi:DedA family protein [Bacillus daqingensis]|uniref:DedA family protein n=1 Tax=Bacillus daqingensis TaxID=872396 RepID=A0ABV9NWH7_9BACI